MGVVTKNDWNVNRKFFLRFHTYCARFSEKKVVFVKNEMFSFRWKFINVEVP